MVNNSQTANRQEQKLKGKERRLYARTSCAVEGYATVRLFSINHWEVGGKVVNISQGGLRFEVSENFVKNGKVHQDDPVTIEITHNHHDEGIKINGYIAHLCIGRDKTSFGIKFRNVHPEILQSFRSLFEKDKTSAAS